jgi:hypothetical protein
MTFWAGLNYPWSRFHGKNNYGCDFGLNVWGSHGGVSAHLDEIGRDFAAMAATGAQVVRWFVFTDGRSGVEWSDGTLAGPAAHLWADLDAALAMALEHRLQLCLVLFDYLWMFRSEVRDPAGTLLFTTHPEVMATPDGRERLFARLIEPLLERYGRTGSHAALGRAIHSFDVINEPDWVTDGLEPSRDPLKLPQALTRESLEALVGGVADRVHALTDSLVTVGGGRAKFAAEWDRAVYGLDYLQVHLYLDVRDPGRDLDLRRVPAAELQLSRPIAIGEFPGNGHLQHPPEFVLPVCSMEEYLDLARTGDYLAAWPWSFQGIDGFGAVDRVQFQTWVARHAGDDDAAVRHAE